MKPSRLPFICARRITKKNLNKAMIAAHAKLLFDSFAWQE